MDALVHFIRLLVGQEQKKRRVSTERKNAFIPKRMAYSLISFWRFFFFFKTDSLKVTKDFPYRTLTVFIRFSLAISACTTPSYETIQFFTNLVFKMIPTLYFVPPRTLFGSPVIKIDHLTKYIRCRKLYETCQSNWLMAYKFWNLPGLINFFARLRVFLD
jgi:hypothetical protein